MLNSFGTRQSLRVGSRTFEIFRLESLEKAGVGNPSRLPFCLKILLENLLRNEDGRFVKKQDIETLAQWEPASDVQSEIAFMPARVLLQDFTGVPAVADLASMRDAIQKMGGDPGKINPLQPAELVIDHSVQVDYFGTPAAFQQNAKLEFERNKERYAFLRWAQKAFRNFRVVPPDTGIVHQVNLEYLARVVFLAEVDGGETLAYPDTLVGTDSHTTMINGLCVVGWGVGGIEAEAAMLGQPISMLIPPVVGFKLTGKLPEGATATDLVLTITEMLRKKGVVGKFVEFYGPGLNHLPLADRATLGNMAPEYGATIAISPIDEETLKYLRFSGRDNDSVELVKAYAQEQGLFGTQSSPEADYSDSMELDLRTVEPSLAGPRRPQDRVPLRQSKTKFQEALPSLASKRSGAAPKLVKIPVNGNQAELHDGSVVVAAITSCTNTSNPSVLVGAGLLAKKAVEKGLATAPGVKTSLAPGSKVVTDYLAKAGLTPYLEQLGFHLVGYGCTTCIGNSGPLPEHVSRAIKETDLVAVSVLSGNRNFEGRIQPQVRANYLASPPLVVAYALAGRMDIDLYNEPLGRGKGGEVYLRDIWPSQQEIEHTIQKSLGSEMFRNQYSNVFAGDESWNSLPVPGGDRFVWDAKSTYVKNPPFFDDMPKTPGPIEDIRNARVLAVLGDSVTTDHISPAGAIQPDSPAGKYLIAQGVSPRDFNSYGARRGNHEVMMRGTFANIRLRNQLVPGTEGGWTLHLPDGEKLSIYDAAMQYADEKVSLVILAGKEYGSGSSRDWAAKGTRLLGVRAVMAESFERIHRSNLVGMGVLPLQFSAGENAATLGLTGRQTFDIQNVQAALGSDKRVTVRARNEDDKTITFTAITRIDTPEEAQYYRHGGILQYVLRQLL